MSGADLRFDSDEALDAFVRRFEAGTAPAGGFTHQGHLAVALAYLARYGMERGTRRMRRGLLAYLRRALGDDDAARVKYRETITGFWMRLLAGELVAADAARPLHERVNALLARYRDAGVIREYYSEARLYGPEARERFLEPDLKPLPPGPSARGPTGGA